MEATQTVQITELARESNIPIWGTNVSPISYASRRTPITREEVEGVREGYMLHNVLTPEECKQFIDITEKMGFTGATITLGNGMMKRKTDTRNNQRVMWQTQEDLWEPLWARIQEHVDPTYKLRNKEWKAYGLNERFRFYKYENNQLFKRHFDGCYPRGDRDMSIFTFIVYLNDNFEGGRTTFFCGSKKVAVQPRQGSALLFPHGSSPYSPEHEGSVVTEGIKYVMRSDVMYRVEEGATVPRNIQKKDKRPGRVVLYE